MPKLTKAQVKAMQAVCHYILDCTNADYDDYVQYCDDYGYDPAKIRGKEQRKHVYAKALIGLGYSFPVRQCPLCGNDSDCTHN